MQKNIVVVGAGYGGITAALRLSRLFRSSSEFSVHLVDRNPYHTIKTQLHEAAIRRSEVTIDIGRIIRRQKLTFHLGLVTSIDFKNGIVQLGEDSLSFEFLVLALGGKANFYSIPGLEQHALPLQTAADAERIRQHLIALCARASSIKNADQRREMLRFVIGGGGLSGVEFAGELVDHLAEAVGNYKLAPDETEIVVVEAADELVPLSPPNVRAQVTSNLRRKGVRILTGTKVVRIKDRDIELSNGLLLASNTLVWTGGIRISQITRKSGLEVDTSGRLIVNKYLQSVTAPSVYAIGDNALAINPATSRPVPAAAQFALQQGRLVAENIEAVVEGRQQREYRPRVWGEVVSLGRHLSVGWLALPFIKKLAFVGFLTSLLKAAISEKHVILLRKEARSWVRY